MPSFSPLFVTHWHFCLMIAKALPALVSSLTPAGVSPPSSSTLAPAPRHCSLPDLRRRPDRRSRRPARARCAAGLCCSPELSPTVQRRQDGGSGRAAVAALRIRPRWVRFGSNLGSRRELDLGKMSSLWQNK